MALVTAAAATDATAMATAASAASAGGYQAGDALSAPYPVGKDVAQEAVMKAHGARAPSPLDALHSDISTAAASTADVSDSATPPMSPGGATCSLLACPWHDAMSFFLTSGDLGRVTLSCSAFRTELTVEAPSDEEDIPSRRLLVVPVVELRVETAEAELERVSLPHIHVLRIWSRLPLVAASAAARRAGPHALRSLDRFLLKGCPLNGLDVGEILVPMLRTSKHVKLLNLEKNQLLDAPIQQLCASGILGRVEQLNLRFNRIGDRGATALAQCKDLASLEWINLKVNLVSDVGALALASALRRNTSMRLLNLRKQFPPLTDKAAKGFAEMLQTNSTLQQLRIRRNRIGDAGAIALAAAAAERLCRASPYEEVRLELDLEENRIGDAGALALLRAAASAPKRANLEICLCSNASTRESLRSAVEESGEGLNANDPRLKFDSKPEFDL